MGDRSYHWQRYVDSFSADNPYPKSVLPLMADDASVRTVAPAGTPPVERAQREESWGFTGG